MMRGVAVLAVLGALVVSAVRAEVTAGRSAVAEFDYGDGGIQGSVRFYQADASANVTIQANLVGLSNFTNGWHVHVFPVLNHENDSCADTGGHYNPFGATTCDAYDQSSCEVGDLSGKYGKFNAPNIADTYQDTIMTLYGEYSVVGRSVVIHSSTGARVACATIQWEGETAHYKVPVSYQTGGTLITGDMHFWQAANDPTSDTWALLELGANVVTSTSGHNYHVHVKTFNQGAGETCDNTGGHWDPDSTGQTCGGFTSDEWDQCEAGDMSGKHGSLTVFPTSASKATRRTFWTDTNLPLTGFDSVNNRSVVIHDGSPRIACGNFNRRPNVTSSGPARMARADFSSAADEGAGPVRGSILFFQRNAAERVKFWVDLWNLEDLPNNYHIHQFPVEDGTCGVASTGGHWNPTGASYPCVGGKSACEAGDLSGKFGGLTTEESKRTNYDRWITLFGPRSFLGRSIVLHRGSDAARYACASILPADDAVTQVSAFFDASTTQVSPSSWATFWQTASDPTGPTWSVVKTWYSSGSGDTVDHNWHVHQTTITSSDCITAGGHYDPFNAPLLCTNDSASWLNCEVGGLSEKHGPITITSTANQDSAKSFFVDTNLPLSGVNTIAGRSVAIHEAQDGATRIACGDTFEGAPVTGDDADDANDDDNNGADDDDKDGGSNNNDDDQVILTTAIVVPVVCALFIVAVLVFTVRSRSDGGRGGGGSGGNSMGSATGGSQLAMGKTSTPV